MKHNVKINYTEAILTKAALNFWLKTSMSRILIGLLLLTLSLLAWFIGNQQNIITTMVIVLSGILCFTTLSVLFVYKKRSLATFKAMKSPVAQWQFGKEKITVKSGFGQSDLKWSAIIRLFSFKDQWLLVFANKAYSTLPLSDLTDGTKTFIKKRLTEEGAKIN